MYKSTGIFFLVLAFLNHFESSACESFKRLIKIAVSENHQSSPGRLVYGITSFQRCNVASSRKKNDLKYKIQFSERNLTG